ncbi:STAS domain-containing protein [Ramlibacter sp. USB13]|uniref:STAS domain-containing protein n=1 Tax=Ramlibacter cellulosilyticus TaxID=2764187 RepID=A0A923MYJ1_9BURK|nr:STAS domain-containing protein [Ramlibacter cellulosilyticus]MBC5786052.1 STAS domain-containing protein [Ramlibacter cellulosilyticus]
MANKDDSAPGGLLSRVVRFVRNPASGFNENEGQDADRESSYSKQMLKEMIERKRRNDFVRKREFDMLRKMRRSEVLAGQDPGLRPSFFQSSMPSKPDDRATTLKKIDEIEAQMSMQWWKTKHGGNSGMPTGASGFPMSAHVPPDAMRQPAAPAPAATSYSRTAPQELAADGSAAAPAPPASLMDSVLPDATTQAMGLVPPQQQPQPAPAGSRMAPPAARAALPPLDFDAQPSARDIAAAGAPSVPGSAPSTFSPSKQFAIHVEEFAHDPELEEASIRFANGDNEGAEAGLLDVLAPHGTRINHDETWLTLFDLYRAAGWQSKFESAAIDFASRFGRSAPQWFSMPEIIAKMNTPTAAQAAAAAGQDKADWTSPAVFGTQTAAALVAALGRATQPYKLNWTKLTSIVDGAVEPLTKLFTQWAGQNVQLRFIGADALEKVLREATPSSDRAVNPGWWKLRMEVLRVMHRPDEFELVALDYCVTYEVSPPSWDSARCDYKSLQPDGSLASRNTIIGEAYRDSVVSSVMTYGDSQLPAMSSQLSSVATVELSGQILGDGKEALELLDAKLADADIMIISCARLMRIDFTAAGTLLNWVTAREGEGRQVQFSDVHRLVAAFFNVIGISEHARITIRNE